VKPRRAVQSVIAKASFSPNVGTVVIDIDRAKLLTDLLTFDEAVIRSSHFGEIPHLVKLFGLGGFRELLDSNFIRISSETSGLGRDISVGGKRALP